MLSAHIPGKKSEIRTSFLLVPSILTLKKHARVGVLPCVLLQKSEYDYYWEFEKLGDLLRKSVKFIPVNC